jgi:adhesin transport system outer membrane protein
MHTRSIAIVLAALAPVAGGHAQEPPQSLVVDPQQGATPRPIENPPTPQPDLVIETPAPAPVTAPATPIAPLQPPPPIRFERPDVSLQTPQSALPPPSEDPLALDRASDPVLALAESTANPAKFADAIRSAVEQHPMLVEVRADRDEAVAIRNEARALVWPVADVSLSYFKVVDRDFSNDPQNILERSRPGERTDALLRLNAPLIDFGRGQARIRSANERISAADASIGDSALRLAQASIAAWYQVFTYRALVRLGEAFVANQDELRDALQTRIEQGASAPTDIAQYDSYRASAQSQLADFRRQLSTAEAQYRSYIGESPPADLGRAPAAETLGITADALATSIENLPSVERARRLAHAAEFDAKATRALELPSVSVGLDAGRYGVFENDRDYDIRASVTLSQRFFGGAKQRTDQAEARERQALVAYDRTRIEAQRDAEIALADVQALGDSTTALRENYFASRQSRDALFERFRFARGTLYDVLTAQTNYFNVAVRFLAAVSELDIARYNLLAKTGRLLDSLDINPSEAPRK